MVRLPNGSVSKPEAFSSSAMRAYSICCAARQLDQDRHQQPLRLHAARGVLPQHLLEQDALVGHVLVDDPQAVAPGGDDEALVNLAERPQIGQRGQALRWLRQLRRGAGRACPGHAADEPPVGVALKSKRGAGAAAVRAA